MLTRVRGHGVERKAVYHTNASVFESPKTSSDYSYPYSTIYRFLCYDSLLFP